MTGEIQEKSVYLCEEREFPIVTFGHTNSELYGVEALAQHLSKEFNMEIIKA